MYQVQSFYTFNSFLIGPKIIYGFLLSIRPSLFGVQMSDPKDLIFLLTTKFLNVRFSFLSDDHYRVQITKINKPDGKKTQVICSQVHRSQVLGFSVSVNRRKKLKNKSERPPFPYQAYVTGTTDIFCYII